MDNITLIKVIDRIVGAQLDALDRDIDQLARRLDALDKRATR